MLAILVYTVPMLLCGFTCTGDEMKRKLENAIYEAGVKHPGKIALLWAIFSAAFLAGIFTIASQ